MIIGGVIMQRIYIFASINIVYNLIWIGACLLSVCKKPRNAIVVSAIKLLKYFECLELKFKSANDSRLCSYTRIPE